MLVVPPVEVDAVFDDPAVEVISVDGEIPVAEVVIPVAVAEVERAADEAGVAIAVSFAELAIIFVLDQVVVVER